MREVVDKAAALWGLDPARITLAAQRENAVWRAEGDDGTYALRLHRAGYRSDDELRSELQWMAALADGGMDVPCPLPSRRGVLIEGVDGIAVDLLTWLPGRMVGAQGALEGIVDRVGHMRRLGGLLAQLHDLSDAWTPPAGFTRPRWDRAGLLGDAPLWGPFWENPGLTAGQRATLMALRTEADAHLARIEGAQDFGLIHADAITENVMHEGERLMLIDFDDGGWGFRDFDLATVLMRQLTAPDYPALRAALLAGYAVRRPVDAGVLDLMLVLRALTYLGWIIPRMGEPGGPDRSARAIATALPLAQRYLNEEKEGPDV
jgi:Ser/Thr protein kinase RdoA (MazF antagonist)